MKKTKIALFVPWIKSKGGAEKVVLEIAKSKDFKVDIYTWIYDRGNSFKDFEKLNIKIIAPKIFQKFSRGYMSRGLFIFASLFSKIPLEKYDLFLISSAGVAEFITFRNYKKGKTLAYVHSPLRAATEEIVRWNLEKRYNTKIKKIIYLMAVKIYRIFEKIAWKRIDFPIFNSEISKKRAKRRSLLKKDSKIIYPPISIKKIKKSKEKKYFFYPSRFNPDKRQDILIAAWKKFSKKNKDYKLILGGFIENRKYYNKIKRASEKISSIILEPNMDSHKLSELYSECCAVIFIPYLEDFGIVPFEAVSYKKPLIAVDRGGFYKLVKDHSDFHKIKDSDSDEQLKIEIEKALKLFIKPKKKKSWKKIKYPNFNLELKRAIKEYENKKT